MVIKVDLELRARDADRAVERGDLIMVIDVLRSGTSIINALVNGAKVVIPTKTLKEAYKLKRHHPSYLLAGERRGHKPRGFDFGNSPIEFTSEKVGGKKMILTTTSGTMAIIRSCNAELVFVGTFLNVGALAKTVVEAAEKKNINISFVLAGDKGRFSFEDFICAGAMAYRFNEVEVCFSDKVQAALLTFKQVGNNLSKSIMAAEHAKHLIKLGFKRDIEFSCQLDICKAIPFYKNGKITLLNPNNERIQKSTT
jgi:2-phosphosulfolactate phosphatase